MLGNDFMPHFPALNIRTNGISILLETYKNIIGPNKYLCNGMKIHWRYFKLFLQELAKNEENYLKKEYEIRNKWSRRTFKSDTEAHTLERFSTIPIKQRDGENFIDPYTKGWEIRYYKQLFQMNYVDRYKKKHLYKLFGRIGMDIRILHKWL